MKFNDILEALESDGKIFDFRFAKSQIPMYLQVKFILLQYIIDKNFNLTQPHVKQSKQSIKHLLAYLYNTLKSNLFFAPKKEIVILSTGIVNDLSGGKYVNKLYSDFATLYPTQTQIVESSTKRSYLLPKRDNIYFRDLIDLVSVVLSKFVKPSDSDLKTIDEFMVYIKNLNLGFKEDFINEVKTVLIKLSKRIDIQLFLYRFYLKSKKPKLLIVEDAHYGAQSYLFKAAHELGITTAEYQHGYIGAAHPAYNYHPNIYNDVKSFLPQFILTHGDYWSTQISTPAEKITIGLSGLTKKIAAIKTKQNPSNKILFISGGMVYKKLNNLILEASESLFAFGYEILLRPHPSERPAINERYKNLIDLGVLIDTANLYDTLSDVDTIVCLEISTVIFEAVCFTKKIYIEDSEYTRYYEPNIIFPTFKDSVDLKRLIKNKQECDASCEVIWEKNWEKNYRDFIENTIGIKK